MYGNRAFDNKKVYVLPNAIDRDRFTYDMAARKALREEFSIPDNAFVVGHVGRFTYAKNHPFLIEMFRRLLEDKPEAYLLLAGEGEMEAPTRDLVLEKGVQARVVFTGVRQDVNKLYSAMDVFCLPQPLRRLRAGGGRGSGGRAALHLLQTGFRRNRSVRASNAHFHPNGGHSRVGGKDSAN